jgi:hypothetical protein
VDTETFVRELFKVDSSVRWVAIVDGEYKILTAKQREGVPSATSEDIERNFFSIFPRIVVDTVEKMSPFLGRMQGMTVHYEKVLLLFYHFGDLTVAISFRPGQETPFFNRVTDAFTKLAEKYLI